MVTPKKDQITGLVFAIISLALPSIAAGMSDYVDEDTATALGISVIGLCVGALVCGIIGIAKSSKAKKLATEAGENKVIAIIGLVGSILGTVYAALIFFIIGLAIACAACAAAAVIASM